MPGLLGLPGADTTSPSLIDPTLSESFPAFGGASFPFNRVAATDLGLVIPGAVGDWAAVAGCDVDGVDGPGGTDADAGEGDEDRGSVFTSDLMACVPACCFFHA